MPDIYAFTVFTFYLRSDMKLKNEMRFAYYTSRLRFNFYFQQLGNTILSEVLYKQTQCVARIFTCNGIL